MDSSALRAANRLRALLREQALLLLLLTMPLRTVLVLTVPLLTTHHASTYFTTYYLPQTTYCASRVPRRSRWGAARAGRGGIARPRMRGVTSHRASKP